MRGDGSAWVLVVLLALLLLLPGVALETSSATGRLDQEPPPLFRAGSGRTGEVPGPAPSTNNTLWTHETTAAVTSSPVVDEGRVYVGTMGGKILCLNAFTGTLIWEYDVGESIESSPAVEDRLVYVGSDDSNVYCLDAATGTLIWKTPTQGEIKSSPVVKDKRVYVGSNDFSVHCLVAGDGDEVWTFRTGGYVYSSPALYGDAVFFGSCDGNMYSVNATSGEENWRFHAAYCPASPAVTGDLVIFGAYDGLLHYLDRRTGEEVRNVSVFVSEIYSSAGLFTYEHDPPLDLPMVLVADTRGKMLGIGGDGEEFWNRSHDPGITASPIVATDFRLASDPFIVYGDEGGTLHGIEVQNPFVPRDAVVDPPIEWKVKLGSSIQSSPFLYHGRVYVGAEADGGSGRVVCVGDDDLSGEVWMDILPVTYGNFKEGEMIVWVDVHGIEPDRVEVVSEGRTVAADPPSFGWGFYRAVFEATPPEGMRPVLVRAIVDDEVVLEARGEAFSLVEGWDQVEVTIEEPGPGDEVDGVILVRGTVRSNYTVLTMRAYWDDELAWHGMPPYEQNWSVAVDTANLSDGEHTLAVLAGDGMRWGQATVKVWVGPKETEPVSLPEVVIVLVLVAVFALLVGTKPSKVDRGAPPDR